MMTPPYALIENLEQQIEPPADGTLSRTLYHDDHLKVVLFGFSAGQELSEHTASTPAMIQLLKGEAEVGLGSDQIVAKAGAWIHMSAALPHRIRAKTPVVMLLTLLRSAKAD